MSAKVGPPVAVCVFVPTGFQEWLSRPQAVCLLPGLMACPRGVLAASHSDLGSGGIL